MDILDLVVDNLDLEVELAAVDPEVEGEVVAKKWQMFHIKGCLHSGCNTIKVFTLNGSFGSLFMEFCLQNSSLVKSDDKYFLNLLKNNSVKIPLHEKEVYNYLLCCIYWSSMP